MSAPVVAHLPDQGAATRLVLLFHGVGSDAPALLPLGRVIGRALPGAAVISVPGPFASDLGTGRQWFSVIGITETNRLPRVAEALPLFVNAVRALQAQHGLGPAETTLVGFSQGAIMSLESVRAGHGLAKQVASLGGRFAAPPQAVAAGVRLHFIHGENDPVIAPSYAVAAQERVVQLGGQASLDLLPATGHEVTGPMAQRLCERIA
ncbi:MAG TPA: esterase [Ramlibacter sp.]|nr:esterase [Ramlibacter sp.]